MTYHDLVSAANNVLPLGSLCFSELPFPAMTDIKTKH